MNRYILMNEAKGLVPGYPQSMLDILGKCNIAAVHGTTHKHMRGALLSLVSPTIIKQQLLPKIDHFMRSHLSNWDNKVIDIQEKTKEVSFYNQINLKRTYCPYEPCFIQLYFLLLQLYIVSGFYLNMFLPCFFVPDGTVIVAKANCGNRIWRDVTSFHAGVF